MIFKQLNEKMRAMDRSLLEKVAADIEMLDQDQGMNDIELEKFILSFHKSGFLNTEI